MQNSRNLWAAAGLLVAATAFAQSPAHPGDWKTWVIRSGADHEVPAPPSAASSRAEIEWLKLAIAEKDSRIVDQIRYWDSGPPTYRWMDMIVRRQLDGLSVTTYVQRVHAYVAMAMYDATIAAENAKRLYNRPRPNQQDTSLVPRVTVPHSSSYPSDYAATAAAAAEVLAYLLPAEAANFRGLAEEAGKSRLYAGVELPSDYLAGLELGRRVAQQVIAKARADGSEIPWTGTVPTGPCKWTGTNPGNVAAAVWKPLLLSSPSEFRPAPPPDCNTPAAQAELAVVRDYPRTLTGPNFATNWKGMYWQSPEGVFPWAVVHLNRWVLEDRMENQPARAARAYALLGATGFDALIASQDGKFTYWYPRPAQVDPTIAPLFPAPNFPAYPSNHSAFSTARAEVLAFLFPARAEFIRALGKEAGDSRIWAGIHFPMDNRAGVTLGEQIARKFIAWAEQDGSR